MEIKIISVIVLSMLFIFIFGSLVYIQKNVISNTKTIDNLEHFIANEIPSYFKDQTISPGCCPSTYSTDRGCVCLDDEAKKMIHTRGTNASL